MKDDKNKIGRRQFLRGAAAVATVSIVPSHVLGQRGDRRRPEPPSEKLNIASIGVGGRGAASVGLGHNVVALCDVDLARGAESFKKYPKAKQYRDFRKMLDELDKQIDAVTVGTPDHTHAAIAMSAIKRGKHVYCEKPLAHSLHEVRELTKAARKYKVATQLGNQGHSDEHIRLLCEWVWDGAIGDVREVHCVCDSSYSRIRQLGAVKNERPPVPDTLDWDLWLGPAQQRPYHKAYCPGSWRGWSAFGTGVIGDWVCHIVDPVFWALNLDAPTSIKATAENYDPRQHIETFPAGTKVEFEFPAREKRPAVKVIWHDGSVKPPRPKELGKDRKMPDKGAIVLGDKGVITYGSHGAGGCRIVPESKMKAYQLPAKTIPRVPSHHQDWLSACKGGRPAGSNFDYGGPLTEVALLGAIGIRFLGQRLEWDAKKMEFSNCLEANPFINPPYRAGWTL